MKKSGPILLASLFSFVFFGHLQATSAQRLYFDPIHGDNHNPGLSSATAKKGAGRPVADQNDRNSQITNAMPWGSNPSDETKTSGGTPFCAVEMTRIILGSETVAGWDAFATTVWQAPFELDQNWTLENVTVNNEWLVEGCSADFLDHQQYYWQLNTLYINDSDGNPGNTGKTVNTHLYNYATDEYSTLEVAGWTLSPPSVWQVEFPTEPIHIFVNDTLWDTNWWYGPLQCEQESGQAGYLYLRDTQGHPDTGGKTVAAVVNAGGWAVAAGDFNGDGYQDVVHSDNGTRIYINYGAADFSATPGHILNSPMEGVSFGFNVASAGDVNHDGFDDLIVSMDWGAKTVYLYTGSPSGLNQTPDRILEPPPNVTAYGFGHGIAGNGDINGDAYSDVLIMGGDATGSYLCVYLGADDGIGPDPDWTILYDGNIYGGSVCFIGDMNRDGLDEVAVSLNDPPPVTQIKILIYKGALNGRPARFRSLRVAIPETATVVHGHVAAAGDVNSDGFSDLVIGNQWAGGDFTNEGKAYLLLGPTFRRVARPRIVINNPMPEFNARFGSIASGIGDLNQDGYADIGIGCPYGMDGRGYVAIFTGSARGISETPAYIISGTAGFGWSLSRVGYLKGVGQPFLAVGEESGGSYLYALPVGSPFEQGR